uniref:Uncharacterized protein LOC114341836 n=1 Tax=Diabrotica virgifera virgifera TaxID=50390 RepID=A0A6P7GT00_DIAVI
MIIYHLITLFIAVKRVISAKHDSVSVLYIITIKMFFHQILYLHRVLRCIADSLTFWWSLVHYKAVDMMGARGIKGFLCFVGSASDNSHVYAVLLLFSTHTF